MLHLLKTSAYFSTGHYACKNKQVQLQSHATFKFATSMKVHTNNLYWMRYCTESQWSDMRTGVMWSCFLLRVINLAAVFWARCNLEIMFIVTNASFVKNLGIFFDRTLCMQKQASAITKSCYFQIRNIECNRSYTSEDACKTLVCSLVASRLDYGNALLFSGFTRQVIPKCESCLV
jgi:hypothetical protein